MSFFTLLMAVILIVGIVGVSLVLAGEAYSRYLTRNRKPEDEEPE